MSRNVASAPSVLLYNIKPLFIGMAHFSISDSTHIFNAFSLSCRVSSCILFKFCAGNPTESPSSRQVNSCTLCGLAINSHSNDQCLDSPNRPLLFPAHAPFLTIPRQAPSRTLPLPLLPHKAAIQHHRRRAHHSRRPRLHGRHNPRRLALHARHRHR